MSFPQVVIAAMGALGRQRHVVGLVDPRRDGTPPMRPMPATRLAARLLRLGRRLLLLAKRRRLPLAIAAQLLDQQQQLLDSRLQFLDSRLQLPDSCLRLLNFLLQFPNLRLQPPILRRQLLISRPGIGPLGRFALSLSHRAHIGYTMRNQPTPMLAFHNFNESR